MTIKEIGAGIKDLQAKVGELLKGKPSVNAEQFEAITADFTTRIESLQSGLDEVAKVNEELRKEKISLVNQVADLEAAKENMEAEHAEALKAKEEEVAEIASKKAATIAASQGVKVVPIKPSEEATSGAQKSVVEQYMELTGPAKVEFYRKHKKEIQAAAKAR